MWPCPALKAWPWAMDSAKAWRLFRLWCQVEAWPLASAMTCNQWPQWPCPTLCAAYLPVVFVSKSIVAMLSKSARRNSSLDVHWDVIEISSKATLRCQGEITHIRQLNIPRTFSWEWLGSLAKMRSLSWCGHCLDAQHLMRGIVFCALNSLDPVSPRIRVSKVGPILRSICDKRLPVAHEVLSDPVCSIRWDENNL